MTRDEHLTWCKERALAYVERSDLVNADLSKHPETKVTGEALGALGLLAAMQAQNGDREAVVRYIKGFN